MINAQTDKHLNYEIINDDTIYFSEIPQVEILSFKNYSERKYYYKLKKKVLKVYPFAKTAKLKLIEINSVIDTIPKRRKRKRYTKKITKWVKEEYTERLKSLTKSEGKILVKLIYRETQTTSYQIVKSYRGRFNAYFWQTMAKFWDNNLKLKYDPVNLREDKLIEHIIKDSKLEN
jgi:hypothetical protein